MTTNQLTQEERKELADIDVKLAEKLMGWEQNEYGCWYEGMFFMTSQHNWRPSNDSYNLSYHQIHLCEMKIAEMGLAAEYALRLKNSVCEVTFLYPTEQFRLLTALPSQKAMAMINVLEGE